MKLYDDKKRFNSIVVTSGSRLHGGFYHIGRNWKVLWGSLGFYIEEPSLKIRIRSCEEISVIAPNEIKRMILKSIESIGIADICIEVATYIPRHVGLGSTTQTLLAVLCGLNMFRGTSCDPLEVSRSLGLLKYSGVGTLLFKYGGFVIDSGLPDAKGPRPIFHFKIPDMWRFIVVLPRVKRGLAEEEEDKIMRNPWNPSAEAERLMSRGTLRLTLGLVRGCLDEVINGLREVQRGTGMYFSKVQGSIYRSDITALVAEAEKDRIYLAQSSWGPTLYTIAAKDMATSVLFALRKLLKLIGMEGNVWIAKPRNKGYEISFQE